MIDALQLASASIAGIALGVLFFGGLWWTVRKAVASKQAAFWFVASMLLRTSIVIVGFYLVMGDDWQRLLAGLFGFTITRFAVMRMTREVEQTGQFKQESNYAPKP